MKFLKTQNTSRFGLKDNTLKVNPYGRYTMDGVGGLRLPKGTTAQQPDLSGVEMPNGPNGMLRYNTTTDELECYIAGFWETVKGSAANSITKQTLGPGDLIKTVFGTLNTTYTLDYTASLDNVMVYVENVFQLSNTNFNIYAATNGSLNITPGSGAEIAATSLTSANNTVDYKYVITSVGTTNWTLIGAASNTVGVQFVKSGGTGLGTGLCRLSSFSTDSGANYNLYYYMQFGDAVPVGKDVTIYYGYAN
jgi:hypothetical protein